MYNELICYKYELCNMLCSTIIVFIFNYVTLLIFYIRTPMEDLYSIRNWIQSKKKIKKKKKIKLN